MNSNTVHVLPLNDLKSHVENGQQYNAMSSILTIARDFRADVLRNDKAMLRQLSSAYQQIAKRLESDLRALQREIDQAQRAGKTVDQDWLRRSRRYQELIRQAKAEIVQFSNGTSRFIEARQRQMIGLGQSHAVDLINATDIKLTFVRLPTDAINEMVGVLQDGSPLSSVLDKLGASVASDIRARLIEGLGAGYSPAKIARGIREAVDVPRWKALQIARTETLRAYRQSSLETYAANDDVLDGWIWISAKSLNTCAACWSLHGTWFPLSKTFFPAHISCRCTSIPSPKGSRPNVQSGSVAFADLDADQQAGILGPSRYEMFRAGTPLDDFVMLTRDKEWGGSYQVRPLYMLKSRKRAA